jgi:hypothetical protein
VRSRRDYHHPDHRATSCSACDGANGRYDGKIEREPDHHDERTKDAGEHVATVVSDVFSKRSHYSLLSVKFSTAG